MTMPTDTKQESRREIAERLLGHLEALSLRTVRLAAIEAALKERDERAAKIAEAYLSDYRNLLTPSAVAAAIRNEERQCLTPTLTQ